MNTALTLAIATIFAASVPANAAGIDIAPDPAEIIFSASDVDLKDFLWLKRPLVVFADNAADPRYVQQMQLLTERLEVLDDRDVVIITDTDPAGRSEARLQLRPSGFMTVVLAKDGTVVLRKPVPWAVRELTRNIDKLPLRQQEIRDSHDTLRE